MLTRELRRRGIALGALTLLGGLGIDMYLPAMPRMAAELGVGVDTVQFTLTTYLLALAIGQPLYGPLADRFGRLLPMRIGTVMFGLASIGCALVKDAETLVVLRFAQGLGASAVMVVSRAMVRDLCTGQAAVRMLATMMMVVGVAPILAPVVGSAVTALWSWRYLFWALAVLSLGGLFLLGRALPETLPPQMRVKGGLAQVGRAARRLFSDRRFLGLSLIPGLTQAATFGFVASSAFVFVEMLDVSAASYSLIFAVSSLALIGGAQLGGHAVERFGSARTIKSAILVSLAGSLLLLIATLTGTVSLPLVCITFLLVFSSVGFIGGPATVEALDEHPDISGTAAAISGAFQMAFSSLGSALVSALADGTTLPLAAVMCTALVAAFIVAATTFALPRQSSFTSIR